MKKLCWLKCAAIVDERWKRPRKVLSKNFFERWNCCEKCDWGNFFSLSLKSERTYFRKRFKSYRVKAAAESLRHNWWVCVKLIAADHGRLRRKTLSNLLTFFTFSLPFFHVDRLTHSAASAVSEFFSVSSFVIVKILKEKYALHILSSFFLFKDLAVCVSEAAFRVISLVVLTCVLKPEPVHCTTVLLLFLIVVALLGRVVNFKLHIRSHNMLKLLSISLVRSRLQLTLLFILFLSARLLHYLFWLT